jgi:UrcA family protein
MKIASIVTASLISLGLAAGAGTAVAADGVDPLSKTVAYGDLNLDTTVGANVLYARIRTAAREVCAPFEGRELARKVRWDSCFDHAVQTAVAQVDKPSLTALYSDKIKASRQG